jgi:hypothetical protein
MPFSNHRGAEFSFFRPRINLQIIRTPAIQFGEKYPNEAAAEAW